MKRSLRFQILARDAFRCRYCGRTSQDDGVQLHVDHVWPASRGGTDDPSNLVTACRDCNLGKRDVLLEDIEKPEPVVEERRFYIQDGKRIRRLPWRDDLFTPDQLVIVRSVQDRRRGGHR